MSFSGSPRARSISIGEHHSHPPQHPPKKTTIGFQIGSGGVGKNGPDANLLSTSVGMMDAVVPTSTKELSPTLHGYRSQIHGWSDQPSPTHAAQLNNTTPVDDSSARQNSATLSTSASSSAPAQHPSNQQHSSNQNNQQQNNQQANKKLSKAERRRLLVAQRGTNKQGTDNVSPAQGKQHASAHPSATVSHTNLHHPHQGKSKKGADDQFRKSSCDKQLALFSHLAAYHRDSKLPDAIKHEMKAKHQPLHPAIVRLGLLFQHYKIVGSNQRCIALLEAFQQIIQDYTTPPNTVLCRHLDTYLKPQINYLVSTRPLSVSMGNAIRFVKCEIASIPPDMPEDDAKELLKEKIENYVRDRITCAATVIVDLAMGKVRDGDVILVFSSSSLIKELLLRAHANDIDFRVIVVDSRPLFEGKKLMKTLVQAGIHTTFAHLSAISYVIQEATKVFLGIHALLSNGFVMSRAGTSTVATMAYSSGVPVIGLCETYKFSDRVQLDSFVNNELGDPDDLIETYAYPEVSETVLQVDSITTPVASTTQQNQKGNANKPSEKQNDSKPLSNWRDIPALKVLNLMYDVTPSDYVTMVITEVGMIPCSSVPVVLREGVKVSGKRYTNSSERE